MAPNSRPPSIVVPAVAVILIAAAACGAAPGPAAAPPPRSAASGKLEPMTLGSIERLHRSDGVYLASQPSKGDLELAKDSGIRTVVNLRKPSEIDWDEKAVVESLGMRYDNFGFKEPEELTDAVLDGARRVLSAEDRKPILLHCASANRVGAVWLAHRVLDDGVAYPDALVEAETVGLKSAAFRDRVKTYVEARRPK
jgi:protein tyrosine phosphatase (PTP) superfamily phosphohydrolase (DUF442 family)